MPKTEYILLTSLSIPFYTPLVVADDGVKLLSLPQYSLSQQVNCGNETQQRITFLSTLLHKARQAYYQGQAPLLSDDRYDAYWSELSLLANCRHEALETVGEALDDKSTMSYLKHRYVMRSLRSVRDDFSSLVFFQKNNSTPIIMQPKIDGVAVELVYENGHLTSASTRGNGQRGKNLTQLVHACSWIPNRLTQDISVVIHGELYIPQKSWIKSAKYVSSRHMAAGIANQSNPSSKDINSLRFMPWLWVDAPYTSDDEALSQLGLLGFDDMARYTHLIKDEVALNHWYQHYQQPQSMPMKLDGVVLKINDLMVREQYGYNQRYPHWALAQKFTGPKAMTRVVDVVNQLGPKGRLTPVVYLTPITLANRQIEKVSGHSIPWLNKMAITKGSEVEVELVGDAIPQIIAVRR